MALIQSLKGLFTPKSAMKPMVKDIALAKTVSAPAVKVEASGADAMASQGKAMVNMQAKKPYVKPGSKVVEIKQEKMTATSDVIGGTGQDSQGGGGGDKPDLAPRMLWDGGVFSGEEW